MHPDDATRLRHLPTRHTRRLRLEPLKEAHAEALFPGLSDGALYEFIGERPPESVEALAARYRRLEVRTSPDGLQLWLNWALWSVLSGSYVGVVQATVHPDRLAHLAFVLFREAWGQGYAREASAATIDHLRDAWGVHDVRATVDVRNHRSIGLLTRLGFQRFAVRRSSDMLPCTPTEEYVYRLRPGEGAVTME